MRSLLVVCAALLTNATMVLDVVRADPPKPAAPKEAAFPASMAGFSDDGVFYLFVNEDRLATINFKWQASGDFESSSTLVMAGQTVKQSLKITADKEGRWETIVSETPRGTMTFAREGDKSKQTFRGKVSTVSLKARATLFDNFAPVLVSQQVRDYDRRIGGEQKVSIFVLSGVLLEGKLEKKETQERSIGGRDLKLTRFLSSFGGVDVSLWVDEANKLYLADVPAQHAAFVRRGYELLRKAPETDPLLSAAKYQVKIDRKVGVPMRDGIKLSTDIYRPETPDKVPVILIRTPYKKEMLEPKAGYYARRGYAVAVQDCRGRFDSPGVWEPFVNEAKDGHDAIEWLAAQPWSTAKVGMIGGSYVGWVQWWAASQHPPHLVTIIPNVSPPDPFYNMPYEYGVFFLQAAIWWAEVVEKEVTGDLSGAALSNLMEKKYQKLLRALPVIDLDKSVLGKENRSWRKWIEHNTNDAYWEQANFLDHLQQVRIPVFHQSGWFDGDGIGTKLNYLRMASHGHPYQKLVLGPWGHTDEAQRMLGKRDFGPSAIIDMQRAYLRWFDYWLKGIDNGITKEPLVGMFVMGSDKWVYGSSYPLPETRFEKWYLASGGQANTSKGDGRLTPETPAAETPVDRYTYDPGDPTPHPDAYEEPELSAEKSAKDDQSSEEKHKAEEAYHRNLIQSRRDILVYRSQPLSKPLTFVGPVSAVLYASSSAPDTDWFMRLLEVEKSGQMFPLAEGKIRARFRRSMKSPEPLKPGEVYEYTLDLWHTGITVPSGSRLQVEVASASFPLFSRNLNTGGHNEKETHYGAAEQTIYHSKKYPSHVLLPVIELVDAKR